MALSWIFLVSLANQLTVSNGSNMLEKANMLLLTKEATEKDCSLKTQLLLTTNSQNTEKNKQRADLEEIRLFL